MMKAKQSSGNGNATTIATTTHLTEAFGSKINFLQGVKNNNRMNMGEIDMLKIQSFNSSSSAFPKKQAPRSLRSALNMMNRNFPNSNNNQYHKNSQKNQNNIAQLIEYNL